MKKPLKSFRQHMNEKSPEEQRKIHQGAKQLLDEVRKEARSKQDSPNRR